MSNPGRIGVCHRRRTDGCFPSIKEDSGRLYAIPADPGYSIEESGKTGKEKEFPFEHDVLIAAIGFSGRVFSWDSDTCLAGAIPVYSPPLIKIGPQEAHQPPKIR